MIDMDDKFEKIVTSLKEKACVKQRIYRQTQEVFERMKTIAKGQTAGLSEVFLKVDNSVQIEYETIHEFDFRLKFSGDLLLFTMHSNVVTYPEDSVIYQSPYIKEDPTRAYFGHIMVYNFMADSVKYNRLDDPGYLIARLMVNHEGHFYIEGVRPLGFLFPDIAQNKVSDELLRLFIQQSMIIAVETDLTVPPFQQVQVIPLGYTLQNEMVGTIEKVGFKMSSSATVPE